MRSVLKWVFLLTPTLAYILFFQLLFPPKFAEYKDFYIADEISIEKEKEGTTLDIFAEYTTEKGESVVEVVKAGKVKIYLSGNININGKTMESDKLVVNSKSNNYILISKNKSILEEHASDPDYYRIKEINEEATTNKVAIGVGTIIGVLFVLLIVRARLPKNIKITISLSVLTVFLFLLQSIISDILWVVISADIGWMIFLILDKEKEED